jgi:hypothetical protein
MRWKRTVWLVLALVSLFIAVMAEHGGPAVSNAIKTEIIAALKDPLNLLDERSPGERGPRVLLSIKRPHERVLSTVRQREVPLGTPLTVDNPDVAAFPEAVASIPIVPPEYDTLPLDQVIGSPSFPQFFPNTPADYSNIIPGGEPTPTSNTPTPPLVSSGTPPDYPNVVPEGAPTLTTNAPNPTTVTPGAPPNPSTLALPEPAPWAMMILGLFGIGVLVRRRALRRLAH